MLVRMRSANVYNGYVQIKIKAEPVASQGQVRALFSTRGSVRACVTVMQTAPGDLV